MITAIVAAGNNMGIGKDSDLCWHLPDDFKRFKEITTGHFILMGRKTFETFPRPLPNRKHLIITNQKDYNVPDDCYVFNTIDDAIKFTDGADIYVIGGGEIYKQCMNIIDKIDITKVDFTPDANVFFPEITNDWVLKTTTYHPKDDRHKYDFKYEQYEKRFS